MASMQPAIQRSFLVPRGTVLAAIVLASLALLIPPAAPAAEPQADSEPADAAAREQEALVKRLEAAGFRLYYDFSTGLRTVAVDDPRVDNSALEMLESLDDVGDMTLGVSHLDDSCFRSIGKLKTLGKLLVFHPSPSDAAIAKLSELPELALIHFFDCPNLTDGALRSLGRIQSLETVKLFPLNRVSAEGFQALAALPRLKQLNVGGESVNDDAARQLATSKSIRELSLGNQLTDDGLKWIAGMGNVQSLTLSSNRITAAGIGHLKAAAGLRTLSLGSCGLVDDDALAGVGQLTQLHTLHLAECPITDKGLAHLNGLTQLRWLALTRTRCTGAGLESLAGLKELTRLHVEGESVTDALFPALSQLPNLQHLHAGAAKMTNHPGITDAGLKQIGAPANLRTINFQGTGITTAGIEALDVLPKLEYVFIIQSPACPEANWNINTRRQQRLEQEMAANPKEVENREAIIEALRNDGGVCSRISGKLHVELTDAKAGDRSLALVAQLGDVRQLALYQGNFTDTGFESVAKLSTLENLALNKVVISLFGFKKLAAVSGLAEIEIVDCSLTDDDLKNLTSCALLRRVKINGENNRISAAGFGSLAALPALVEVEIQGVIITDDAVERLVHSASLKRLSLHDPALSDEALKSIAGCEHLESLSLIGANRITGAGLANLKSAVQLTALELRSCVGLDDKALPAVGHLTNLRELSLSDLPITDAGLAELNSLAGLEELRIWTPGVTGAGLGALTSLRRVRQLRVFGDSVSDDVFASLAGFRALNHLGVGAGKEVEKPGITNAGLKRIVRLPVLTRIDLEGTGVTPEGLAPLGERLANLHDVVVNSSPSFTGPNVWQPPRRPK